jgi:hypothetical protein
MDELQFGTDGRSTTSVKGKSSEKERPKMATVFCLDCNHPVSLGSRPVEGQLVTCSNCGTQLEVIGLNPLELDWAYLEPAVDDEEWEWDWEEEWDKDWEKEEAVP